MNSLNIIPQAGLCNRLRVLFSYLKIANDQNKTLNVFWVESAACNGFFLDVFMPIPNVNFVKEKPTYIDYAGYTPAVKLTKNDYVSLIPTNDINSLILDTTIYKDYNAMHIRRTDHTKYVQQKQKITNDVVFENFVDASNLPVYLACDNRDTQQQFLAKYPDKVFINREISRSPNKRQTSLVDAVIDLFMCVKSKKFLGTNYSSYSDLIKLLK